MLRLGEIMSTEVETISPSEPAELAYRRMRDQDIHHLVVVEDGHAIGVVSERDLGGRAGAAIRREHTIGDLMSTPIVTAEPDTTLREAAKKLVGRSIGCLPVLDHRGRTVGIVTITDVLQLIARGAERPVAMGRRRSLRTEPGRWKGPSQHARRH
jgi:CBS domain-containing protein